MGLWGAVLALRGMGPIQGHAAEAPPSPRPLPGEGKISK